MVDYNPFLYIENYRNTQKNQIKISDLKRSQYVFLESLNGVSRVFLRCFKGVSRLFQSCCYYVSRVFQGSF